MKTFLEYVAEDILKKYGNDLSRIAVVFPNKRASLFLNAHLARLSEKPIWSPVYVTISDLFRQYSDKKVADPIKLICDLHRSFIEQTGFDETLDHFYSWGQLLLADFDDIDKNMADANKVFANLRDLHELDDESYLSDEQKEIIRKFFSNFSDDHNSQLKERFLKLWSHISDIYHAFNDRLTSQQLAYEGALYREVAVKENINLEYDQYLFVGFNLLQQVEQKLFTTISKQGKAKFYWDFDAYYIKDHEAGHYINQYLKIFPNELENNSDIFQQFKQHKDITFISAPTENIQTRYASSWLNQARIADGRKTAIVLCDEKLLQSLLHCLPDEVDKVNITTGFPLSQSPVSSLCALLFDLQTVGYNHKTLKFRPRYLTLFKNHPYADFIPEEKMKRINGEQFNHELLEWMIDILRDLAPHAGEDEMMQEAIFRMYTLLNRLLALVDSGDLVVDHSTLRRLLTQLIQSTSIPFHGEPAEGIQLMGVLETRNLDFSHILLLSCNEGNMPKGVGDTSFIPYSLRKAYGLTTIDHKVAIFSYYFHRLLQRADDITICYNNATTDGHTGEMSRFMLQLMAECPHPIRFQTLQAGQSFTPFAPQAISKTPQVMEKLNELFSIEKHPGTQKPLLTPTAINRYLRCQLQFYYNYICQLRELDELDDEENIDNRLFGDIFHEAAQIIYERITGKKNNQVITADVLSQILKSKIGIETAVDEAFNKVLQLSKGYELNGLQLINREVIIHYLRTLLEIDRRKKEFTILGLETDVWTPLTTPHISTIIGGRIDRLDMIDGQIRVVDYKTGSHNLNQLPDVDAIFSDANIAKHSDYYLQTFLYASIVSQSNPTHQVAPALLFIQRTGEKDYNPILKFGKEPINDLAPYKADFDKRLSETVDEIFNPDISFNPTTEQERCAYCPYKKLCSV